MSKQVAEFTSEQVSKYTERSVLNYLKSAITRYDSALDDGEVGGSEMLAQAIENAKNGFMSLGESEELSYRLIGRVFIDYEDLYEGGFEGNSLLFKFINASFDEKEHALEASALIINIIHEDAKNFVEFTKILQSTLPKEKYHLISDQKSDFLQALKSSEKSLMKKAYMAAVQVAAQNGRSDLHDAVMNRDIGSLKRLIAAGADQDAQDDFGRTASHYAVFYNFSKGLSELIKTGARRDIEDQEGLTPLDIAIIEADTGVVYKYFKKLTHLDIGKSLPKASLDNLLPLAAFLGAQDLVEKLLTGGASVNMLDRDGNTPLRYAALNNQIEVIFQLTAAGADPNIKSWRGALPIVEAVIGGRDKITAHLIEFGADPNIDIGQQTSLLHYAATEGMVDVVKALLTSDDLKINELDGSGRTPLDYAVSNINIESAFELIKAGAIGVGRTMRRVEGRFTKFKEMIDASTNKIINLDKILFDTIHEGDERGVVYLTAAGANFDITDEYGKTPLRYCIYNEMLDAAFTLIVNKMGDIKKEVKEIGGSETEDKGCKLAGVLKGLLLRAAFYGKEDLMDDIFAIGVNIEPKNTAGQTPLHNAVIGNHGKIVKTLLEFDADVFAKDDKGRVPLSYAIENRNVEVIVDLTEKMYVKSREHIKTFAEKLQESLSRQDFKDVTNGEFLQYLVGSFDPSEKLAVDALSAVKKYVESQEKSEDTAPKSSPGSPSADRAAAEAASRSSSSESESDGGLRF